jgi:hypothetical protein
MPVAWDETRVLAGSQIGRAVAFGRRSRNEGYLGVLNAADRPVHWKTDLGFVAEGRFAATVYQNDHRH